MAQVAIVYAIFAAAAYYAPPPTLSDEQAIEIIGRAPAQIRHEALEYVRQLGIASGDTAASRWLDPVCPLAIGLAPAQERSVEQHIREVAATVGAPVAGPQCAGNLVVAFTDAPKDIVSSIARKAPLGSVSAPERDWLEHGNAAIRWWYSNELKTRDGSPMGQIATPMSVTTDASSNMMIGGSTPGTEHSGTLTQPGSSIVSSQTKRAITHATVVVDVNASRGKALDAILDYAALVGLAEVRFGASAPNSILGLFDGGSVGELSKSDYGLLRGLYAMHMDRRADQQRRVLTGAVIHEQTRQ